MDINRKLECDKNLIYRNKEKEQQDKIQQILKEEMENLEREQIAEEAEMQIFQENAFCNMINNNEKEKRILNESTAQLYENKLEEALRELFVECVIEALPIVDEIKKQRKEDMKITISDIYDNLNEAGAFDNYDTRGCWSVLKSRTEKYCAAPELSAHDAYVEVVNECHPILFELVDIVSNKIERAVKMEKEATILKENVNYIPKKASLFRSLTESSYKHQENEENKANEAIFEASVMYGILETINTSKMVDYLDYDYVTSNFRRLGK